MIEHLPGSIMLALFIVRTTTNKLKNLPPTVENVAIKYRSFIFLRPSALYFNIFQVYQQFSVSNTSMSKTVLCCYLKTLKCLSS